MIVAFFVPGSPMGKGDHTAQRAGDGRVFLREKDAGAKERWREGAAVIARRARGEHVAPFACAVRVVLEVLRVRPGNHYGTRKGVSYLKPSAPPLPTSAPDLDKLQRSLGDALKGVLWRDDALISTWIVTRRWADEAGIRVTAYEDTVDVVLIWAWAKEAA